MAKQTIYRDITNGRFVSKKTYKHSRSHGGKRYKRQKIERKRKKAPPLPPQTRVHEYIISFSYSKSGRTFDVIVTATSRAEALDVAKIFLSKDTNGRKIAQAGFSGWSTRVAKGRVTNEAAGEAEYRQDSEEEEE